MMTIFTRASDRQTVTMGKQIASSGEGEVWETNFSGILAKIYHNPTPERIEKLKAMLANPPVDPMKSENHISIAFPQDLLQDESGNCVGFLMPAVFSRRELSSIYNPRLRKKNAPGFNWYYLHVTALNIARIIQAIHEQGYVLGDIKPQNILVNDSALVAVIDTDSFQVCDRKSGKVYRCPGSTNGFTPVELLGKDFSKTDRSEVSDRFCLAVLIHYLLFGYHPFSGEWVGAGASPNRTELIGEGFWYGGNDSLIRPSQDTIPLDIVHPEIKRLFLKCFNDGHASPQLRPTAEEWHNALQVAVDDLAICSKIDNHHYSQNYGKCYWCERSTELGVDIFSAVSGSEAKPTVNETANVAADENLGSMTRQRTTTNPTAESSPSSSQTSRQSTSQPLSKYSYTQPLSHRQSPPVQLKKSSPIQTNKLKSRLWISGTVLLLGLWGYNVLPSAWQFSTETAAWKKATVFNTLKGHPDSITSVAISPDGQTLVSGDWTGTIKVWNLATGLEIRTINEPPNAITSVAISPDGQTFVSCGGNSVKVWNLATGEVIRAINKHFNFAKSVAISPDGQTLVIGGNNISVWNLTTGEEIRTIEWSGEIESVAISPDGKTLVGGTSLDGTVMWDFATGEEIRTLKGHAGYVTSVAISPDGKTVVSGTSVYGTIKVWNFGTGEEVHTLKGGRSTQASSFLFIDPSERVLSLAISPDGKILISGIGDGNIRMWHLSTGKEISTVNRHSKSVLSVAISPDGHTLVSGSGDKTINVWHTPR